MRLTIFFCCNVSQHKWVNRVTKGISRFLFINDVKSDSGSFSQVFHLCFALGPKQCGTCSFQSHYPGLSPYRAKSLPIDFINFTFQPLFAIFLKTYPFWQNCSLAKSYKSQKIDNSLEQIASEALRILFRVIFWISRNECTRWLNSGRVEICLKYQCFSLFFFYPTQPNFSVFTCNNKKS